MTSTLRIAWRNLWRHRRRTWISMSAIALGLLLVIVYGGIVRGVMADAADQLDTTGMGHVELTARGWRARREVGAVLPDVDAVRARLALPSSAQVSVRVVARGLLGATHGDEGIELYGVDWQDEAQVSSSLQHVVAGAIPAHGAGSDAGGDDDNGLLLGEELAGRLHVRPGERMRATLQRADGTITSTSFVVGGIYHAASPAIGRRRVFVHRVRLARVLGIEGGAHQIVVQLSDSGSDTRDVHARTADLATRVRATLPLDGSVVVQTWEELAPIFGTMESLMNGVLTFAAVFIYLLVGLGIVNTMLMSVLERTREFGVLQALGTRPSSIVALVLAESFWIATIAVAIGVGAGLVVTYVGSGAPLLDFRDRLGETIDLGGLSIASTMRTRFSIIDALRDASWVYAMALLVGLVPAWRVARMQPVDALRG